jgi:hypothetical protein
VLYTLDVVTNMRQTPILLDAVSKKRAHKNGNMTSLWKRKMRKGMKESEKKGKKNGRKKKTAPD